MKAKIDVDAIMAWEPCQPNYTREIVTELFDAHCAGDSLTLAEAVTLQIPAEDILWLVLRPDFFSDRTLHEIAIWCWDEIAKPIWDKHYPDDNRPGEAVRIKKLWLNGVATIEELAAASAAARAAAREAAGKAANKKILAHIKSLTNQREDVV